MEPADYPRMHAGVRAIEEEIEQFGTQDDKENLQYILRGRAQHPDDLPRQVKEDIRTGHYHGGDLAPGDYDDGHRNMTLADFMQTREVVIAKLSEAELVATRLYTTSSYKLFNTPLRNKQKPHPLRVTVFHLSNSLKKLRSVRATLDPAGFNRKVFLYRGMKDMCVDKKRFRREGGTELAPMSTTKDKKVAMSYALSDQPLLFKFATEALETGVSIEFVSVYPKEREYLYPPLTFLKLISEQVEEGLAVLEVKPQMP